MCDVDKWLSDFLDVDSTGTLSIPEDQIEITLNPTEEVEFAACFQGSSKQVAKDLTRQLMGIAQIAGRMVTVLDDISCEATEIGFSDGIGG